MSRNSLVMTALQVVLLPAAVLLCGWFGLNSTQMSAYLQLEMQLDQPSGAFSVGRFATGRSPGQVHLFDIEMFDRIGKPIFVAKHAFGAVNLSDSHKQYRDLRLAVENVTVDDFELTLEWDRFGRLSISDVFKRRYIRVKTKKKPRKKLHLDLRDITLNKGRLHLIWPTFGLSFDAIDTKGAVRVSKDGLSISVPQLHAANSVLWFKGGSPFVAAKLAEFPHDNNLANTAPGNLKVPIDSLEIKGFTWSEGGFKAHVNIQSESVANLDTSTNMSFGRGEIHHSFKTHVTLNNSLVSKLTGGRINGLSPIDVETQGTGIKSKLRLSNLAAGHLALGPVSAEMLNIANLSADTRKEKAALNTSLKAGKFSLGNVELRGLSATFSANIGWSGFEFGDVVAKLSNQPASLTIPAIMGTADVNLASAKAKELLVKSKRWQDVEVNELNLSNTKAAVRGSLKQAKAKDHGHLEGTLKTNVSVGLSGVSGEIVLDLAFQNVPASTLRKIAPGSDKFAPLSNKPVSGKLQMRAPITKPHRLKTVTVALEDAP